ncbi:MAG TPA: glycosyltransferase family 4 protein [Dehalococcoidia bacterium]|nr:glycosyltransferase family 4 protein [Dehalococcoidia bacterium]
MRILVVSPYDLAISGGVTSHVNQVVKQFRRMGHEALLLGPASRPLKPDRFTVRIGGTIRFFSKGDAARINFNPLIIREVRRFLSGQEFDVVHLHEPFVPFLGPAVLKLGKAIKIGTYHASRSGPHWPYIVILPFIRFWDRRLDGRIAVSGRSQMLINRYVPGDYKIIPNGIDFGRFATPAGQPQKFRDSNPTILYVGRLEPRKGVEYLIRAFPMIKAAMPKARLVIVGEGGLMDNCQRLVRRLNLDDVFFEGHVPGSQLPGYFQRADLVCVPSTGNESFGIVLAEAMAAGTPVVASRIEGFRTLIEDRRTGVFAEPRDPESIAEKALMVLQSGEFRQELIENGQEKARRYDWENVCYELLEYYESLLETVPASKPRAVLSTAG